MEQDVQLHRGLSREVLRHGWLPRLRNVARRFAERSVNLCPSALCCSRSSSSPSGITRTTQQPNATMNKVLSESYRNICLPQFMTAEETPSPVKSPYKDHRSTTMIAKCYSSDDDHPSTLVRMSSSSTSTDELHCPQSNQSVDDRATQFVCMVTSKTAMKDLTVNSVDCATQYETVDVDSYHCPVNVVKHSTTSGTQFPQTAAVSTQVEFPKTSTGTQHDLETKDLAIQATKETTSMGIQCAHEMVTVTTQAGSSVQSAGVQVTVDMTNSATQAVVVTKNNGTQAVHDTMTQGTQYELVSETRSTQTEEQYQMKNTSPADLREEIACLVTRFIHKDSKVFNLDKFNDVEDKVRQFLDIMEDTYKESPPEPESNFHPPCDSASLEKPPSDQDAQQPSVSVKSPAPKDQELSQVAVAVFALGMSQSDTGLIHPDLQPEDECNVQPLVSWPSCGSVNVQYVLDEWKKEDISEGVEKTKFRHEQDSPLSMAETSMGSKEPGQAQNTQDPRESHQQKEETTAENLERSVHSSHSVSRQWVQQIPLGLHTDNIPDLNVANDMDGLPSSYFNTLADIGSFWRECSSGQTTRQHIPDQRSNQCGPVILPADPLRSQASTISGNQGDSKVSQAQSVTLVHGVGSFDIWGEIEDAMEGCGEPEVSSQPVDAAKEEGESPHSHTDIPLPGTYCLTHTLSIPGFFLLNHDVPDRRSHALHVRGGVKSDSDKDRTTYDFDWDEAIDFSKTCKLAPKPSENCESQHRNVQQHANSFAVQLNQLLQQVQDRVREFASHNQQDSGVEEGTKGSSSESFTFVNSEQRKKSSSWNSNMVSSDEAAPTVMHVEDFLDAQHMPESDEIEDGWVDVQKVKIPPAVRQASQERCGNGTTIAQVEGSTVDGGAVGGFTVECFPPGFYQDAQGYQVPDVDIPVIGNDDIEVQLRDDGSKWVLGAGSFGTVEAAFYKSPEGPVVEVAVKKYFLGNSDAIIREGKIMQYLQKTGVFPKFYGFMNIGKGSKSICLVSELFARGKTLGDILHGVGYSLEPNDWMNICMQLAKGLRKIHQMQVIFSDLKENNVLVDISGTPVVKLIDLGISTFRKGISYDFTAEELRPLRHIAPEVKQGAPTSFLSDIWGLGILLLDIATISGVPGLEHVAEAALVENPEQRMSLDGIITALPAIFTRQKLF